MFGTDHYTIHKIPKAIGKFTTFGTCCITYYAYMIQIQSKGASNTEISEAETVCQKWGGLGVHEVGSLS